MKNKDGLFSFLALFCSFSTLFCCALPIIFISIGAGAAFASLSAKLPFVSFLGEYALSLFILSFIFLLIAGYFVFMRPQSCPTNKKLTAICKKSKKIAKIVFFIACLILVTSFFFKYILILIV